MSARVCLGAAALLMAACGVPPPTPSSLGNEAIRATGQAGKGTPSLNSDWARGGCQQLEPVSAFVGQDTAAMAEALGKPIADEQFKLGEGMNEFRIELQNDLPLQANADLSIQDQTWAKDGCELTLWSVARDGSLRVVRAMRWPAGAEF